MGLGERGVQQVPAAGGLVQLNVTTRDGKVPVTLIIDPADVSPAFRAQMIARAHRWLDRLDPPLQLVSGVQPPPPPGRVPPLPRSPAR